MAVVEAPETQPTTARRTTALAELTSALPDTEPECELIAAEDIASYHA